MSDPRRYNHYANGVSFIIFFAFIGFVIFEIDNAGARRQTEPPINSAFDADEQYIDADNRLDLEPSEEGGDGADHTDGEFASLDADRSPEADEANSVEPVTAPSPQPPARRRVEGAIPSTSCPSLNYQVSFARETLSIAVIPAANQVETVSSRDPSERGTAAYRTWEDESRGVNGIQFGFAGSIAALICSADGSATTAFMSKRPEGERAFEAKPID